MSRGRVAGAPQGLDWRAGAHATRTPAPCVHCRLPTPFRDIDRRPSHKVCAEIDAGFDVEPTYHPGSPSLQDLRRTSR